LVHAPAVGRAAGAAIGERPLVLEFVAVDVEHPGPARPRRGLDDVELALVRREAEAVRPVDAVGHDRRLPGRRIEAVERHLQLALGAGPLVIEHDPEGGIGKPDRAVGLDHDVVWRIEALALEPVDQHGDRAVVFGAGDAAREMLAGDEAALAVAGVAVGVVGRFAEFRDGARGFVPAQNPVVGNVGPEQIAAVAEPDRPLAPACAVIQPLDRRIERYEALALRIENPHGGIGIGFGLPPHGAVSPKTISRAAPVVDTVTCEPVSRPNSALNREKYREIQRQTILTLPGSSLGTRIEYY
jgi:hypothetical protein